MDAFEKWAKENEVSTFPYVEAAFRAGMRRAAAMCREADKSTHPTDLGDAILAEAEK